MDSWSRTIRLSLSDVLLGLVGGCLLYWRAVPLRAGGEPLYVGVVLPMSLLLGVLLGLGQWWLARRLNTSTAVVLALVVGLPVLSLVDFGVQLTRTMPVPGGGRSLDPSAGELAAGLLHWGAFAVAAAGAIVTAHATSAMHRTVGR